MKKKRKMKTRVSGSIKSLPPLSHRASFSHWIVLLLVVLLSGAAVLRAAEPRVPDDPRKPYALIFGTVWGPDDRPVYGVKVKIRRADKNKAKWELISNHTGEFAQRVPAGKADYVVWVEAKDLKGIKASNGNTLEPGPSVTVQIAGDERQDIGLHLK
jgi:hypothetical protein